MDSTNKKRLWIFIAAAYGLVVFMSIFMFIGLKKEYDLTAFVNTQMLFPACGVILGKILVKKDDEKLPMAGFITVLATAAVMFIMSLLSVFIHFEPMDVSGQKLDIWNFLTQFPLILGAIIAYTFFWTCGKEIRQKNGLAHNNIKMSIIMVLVFIALFLGRVFLSVTLSDLVSGTHDGWEGLKESLLNIGLLINLIALPVNFFLAWIAFFGEEYGWRYYLQPVMQNKFGKRLGVILLGLVWAVWHLDADFMFYTTTDGPVIFAGQIITCTVIAIFFGYAYMKTNNIWVPVIMHFLNNNVAALFAGGGAEALQNQSMEWKELPLFALSSIAFALFIFMPIYSSKREAEKIKF